jgi:hypothetical protein
MEHLEAVQHLAAMRGGSQSHLMQASNNRRYVVKFQNNPQGLRILANEMLGSRLAKLLDLPVAEIAVITVSDEVIKRSPKLRVQLVHGSQPCQAGLCCGSLFVEGGRVFLQRYIPVTGIENAREVLGMLVFDKWTSNVDWRQMVFSSPPRRYCYTATMIDQGSCFNRGKWDFRDDSIVGFCPSRELYASVKGLPDFEPWLDLLEHKVTLGMLRAIAQTIPPEWYRQDSEALSRLLIELEGRRMRVRQLLRTTLRTRPDYFPRYCDSSHDQQSQSPDEVLCLSTVGERN